MLKLVHSIVNLIFVNKTSLCMKTSAPLQVIHFVVTNLADNITLSLSNWVQPISNKEMYTVLLLFEEVVYSLEFQLATADGNLCRS